MTHPLFDIAKCNVPFIQSVDFRFTSDCSIKPPPPPIFDCPEPPKTFRVVPECPSIDGSIMVSTGLEGCLTPRTNFVVTRIARCGGNQEAGCNFFIDLDLALAAPVPPCPSINGSIKVTTFAAGGAGAVMIQGVFNSQRAPIVEIAARHRLPTMWFDRQAVQAGGLISLSANTNDIYKRAAVMVDRILKGAKPADLPVEQPAVFELVINQKTARALGIVIPRAVVAQADDLIE